MTNINKNETNFNQKDVEEGQELSVIFKKRENSAKRTLRNDLKDDGAMVRLGTLILKVRQDFQIKKISSTIGRKFKLNEINKNVQNESVWLVENLDTARSMMKSSKKGFTSVESIRNAIRIADKKKNQPKEEVQEQPTKEEVVNETSNVGTFSVPKELLSASDIIEEAFALRTLNNVDLEDFIQQFKAMVELELESVA